MKEARRPSPPAAAELLLVLIIAAVGAGAGAAVSGDAHRRAEDGLRAALARAEGERERLVAELRAARQEADQALRSLEEVQLDLAAARQSPPPQADPGRGGERGRVPAARPPRPRLP